ERRSIGGQQQVHRHHLHAQLRGRWLDDAVGDEQALAAHAQHLRLRRAVEVRVEDADLPAVEREGAREARRERRLADAALARHDGHERATRLEPLLEPPLLSLDLPGDVRAAVADDVLVALHAVSSAHAARAMTRSAATVTIMNTIAPRRKVISPPHGAATLAVSGRSATCSTCHARTSMNAARTRAKSRRA